MSDPVTNVEIEDVLSSIRRLVSDGDKARTRDPAPAEPEDQGSVADDTAEATPPESERAPKPEKFVLTPAFMVVDNDRPSEAAAPGVEEEDEAAADVAFVHQSDAAAVADEADTADAPDQDDASDVLGEAEPSAEAFVLRQPAETDAATPSDFEEEATTPPSPEAAPSDVSDRSSLVATIAELEAAVSGGANDYELDGSEVVEEAIDWPGGIGGAFDPNSIEDAEEQLDEGETAQTAATPSDTTESEDSAASPVDTGAAAEETAATSEPSETTAEDDPADDVYADDDLDGLMDVGGISIDEEALKDLVADVVRAELTGPLGERITRNVRKLVRREIYRILSSQDFD